MWVVPFWLHSFKHRAEALEINREVPNIPLLERLQKRGTSAPGGTFRFLSSVSGCTSCVSPNYEFSVTCFIYASVKTQLGTQPVSILFHTILDILGYLPKIAVAENERLQGV